MKKHILNADVRNTLGKKVKNLRAEGKTPATVYGKNTENVSLTVSEAEFEEVYVEAGETGVIELHVGNDIRPVLVHNVQTDPVDGNILHVEFYQVNLKEKVKAQVRVVLVGESPAVNDKVGVLLSVLDEVEVEALPGDLPDHIELDISTLASLNQELAVKDLHVSSAVSILTDPDLTVVKIASLVQKEEEPTQEAPVTEVIGEEGASTESDGEANASEGESDEG